VFRRGAAILARALDVPIVPAWFEGMDRLLPRGARWPRLGPRLSVRFGAPIDPKVADGAHDPAAALTEVIRERVLALGSRP
jgi:1-acyl-sn-glycerol-3-phosphate acyltransferase